MSANDSANRCANTGWLAGVVLALGLLGTHGDMHAQAVALSGILGAKALLVVDGGTPKAVAAGETHQGVKVVSTQGDSAVLEIGDRSQ